jgi:hypothetical protein
MAPHICHLALFASARYSPITTQPLLIIPETGPWPTTTRPSALIAPKLKKDRPVNIKWEWGSHKGYLDYSWMWWLMMGGSFESWRVNLFSNAVGLGFWRKFGGGLWGGW